MATRLFGTLRTNRERVIPLLVAALLLSGLFFSLFGAKPAQADYSACGYGYSSSSGSSYGYGTGYGYGVLSGVTGYGYGYGDQICPIVVTTPSLPNGTVGTAYSQQLTATGGTQSFTWSSTSLPAGLSLVTSGANSGLLYGTPSAANIYSITFTATDGNGQTASKTFSLTINPANSGGSVGGGGGTTTTTSTTTTTVAPTTTTTTSPKPKYCNLFATRFLGFAVVGRGMSRAIIGGCFYAQPKVTSNEAGTRVGVLHDNGRVLVVRVTVPGGSKPGWHTLTIREPNGKICRVNYLVRILPRR